jgi:hypothetical protein
MSQNNAPLSFPGSRVTTLGDADLTITAAQFNGLLLDANTNTNTLTLPDPATLGEGLSATFANLSGANVLTLATPGAETINGAASLAVAVNTSATVAVAAGNYVTV